MEGVALQVGGATLTAGRLRLAPTTGALTLENGLEIRLGALRALAETGSGDLDSELMVLRGTVRLKACGLTLTSTAATLGRDRLRTVGSTRMVLRPPAAGCDPRNGSTSPRL